MFGEKLITPIIYTYQISLTDNLATPSESIPAVGSFLVCYDGTNWDLVRGNSADGLLVNLGTNNDIKILDSDGGSINAANPLPVAFDSVTDLKKSYEKQTSIAAGGQATFNSTQISSGKTGKLLYIKVTSSVAIKVSIMTVENAIASAVIDEDFGWSIEWKTINPDFITQAENVGAGLDAFRVVATNLDISLAADISCVFGWDEV